MNRPEPVRTAEFRDVDFGLPPPMAAEWLHKGEFVLVTDQYRTGVRILEALRELIGGPRYKATYEEKAQIEHTFRKAAMGLIVPIKKDEVALNGFRPIGFLAELYPGLTQFQLPFIQVQELYGAWVRYQEGVHLPVIGRKIHPFYGTYFPTRMSHLELFGTWLSGYKGSREQAIDVGTGCGVLALMLNRVGFEQVLATDCNANAVESVKREVQRFDVPPAIIAQECDLLGESAPMADLVVFNPPWIAGQVNGMIDRARFYEEDLFERFFTQARSQVKADGRVAIVFSNVVQLVRPDVPHPIEEELERGRFKLVQKLQRRVKPDDVKRGSTRRTKERVELWELAPI